MTNAKLTKGLARHKFAVGCALLMALFALHSWSVGYSSDDGFIAFQYVKNLTHGNGPVYNAGERVEGYNNILWIVLLAGVSKLLPTVKLLHIAQALGILFGCLTILLVYRFSRKVHGERGPFILVGAGFLALHSGLVAWATGGLETTLFACLVFAAASTYVYYMETGKGFFAIPVLFALAALTRPDAILLFGLTVAHAFILALLKKRKIEWSLVVWPLIFAAIYVPYFVWRYSYYGYPLPNTFYAKVSGATSAQYLRGARYLIDYVKAFGVITFVPPIILLLRRKRVHWVDYFAILVGSYLVYLVYVGGDGLAFFRFVAYIAPLLYILVQEGFLDLYERAKRAKSFPAIWKVSTVALLLVCFGFTAKSTALPLFFGSTMRWYEPHSQLSFPGLGQGHRYYWFDNYFVDRQALAAKWLEENAVPGAVVASTPAGSIAFHLANHKVIDMLGLNDVHIAHTTTPKMGSGRAGHEKGDGKYVLSRSPDYILLGNVAVLPFPLDETTMRAKLIRKSEKEIWADPEFHKNYEIQCVRLADSGPFQYFTFYQKKGLGSSNQAKNVTEESTRRLQ